MPINIQKDLPAREILEEENLFVMDEERAVHQDIRILRQAFRRLLPDTPATHVCTDQLQARECFGNLLHPVRIGISITPVTCMNTDW